MSTIELPHHHHNDAKEPDWAANLPRAEEFASAADVLKILGDTTRIRIFWILCHCEECVINISALVGMSSPAVSHHLRLLKSAALITSRRDGKEMYYTAAKTPKASVLHQAIERMLDAVCPTEH